MPKVQNLDKLVLTIYQNNPCIRWSQTEKKAVFGCEYMLMIANIAFFLACRSFLQI